MEIYIFYFREIQMKVFSVSSFLMEGAPILFYEFQLAFIVERISEKYKMYGKYVTTGNHHHQAYYHKRAG